MRLIGHVVARNEERRYLRPCLEWLGRIVHKTVFFDDLSTDGTAKVAREMGCHVVSRLASEPSFAEDESAFRQLGWEALGEVAEPNDWVLLIDADEFLVSTGPSPNGFPGSEHHMVMANVDLALTEGVNGLWLDVAEIWSLQDECALQRVDGYWAGITACRLVRYQEGGEFASRKEGGGSAPTYATPVWSNAIGLKLLHLGYARAEDRRSKHARYSKGRGHNPKHVASIVEQPLLRQWEGPIPSVLL